MATVLTLKVSGYRYAAGRARRPQPGLCLSWGCGLTWVVDTSGGRARRIPAPSWRRGRADGWVFDRQEFEWVRVEGVGDWIVGRPRRNSRARWLDGSAASRRSDKRFRMRWRRRFPHVPRAQ